MLKEDIEHLIFLITVRRCQVTEEVKCFIKRIEFHEQIKNDWGMHVNLTLSRNHLRCQTDAMKKDNGPRANYENMSFIWKTLAGMTFLKQIVI